MLPYAPQKGSVVHEIDFKTFLPDRFPAQATKQSDSLHLQQYRCDESSDKFFSDPSTFSGEDELRGANSSEQQSSAPL